MRGRIPVLVLMLGVGCTARTEAQRVCDRYARTFAEAAALTCGRGTVDDNLAAFKSAAAVGSECGLVQSIRDRDALEDTCFPWFDSAGDGVDGALECVWLDDRDAYLENLPDACREQLEVL